MTIKSSLIKTMRQLKNFLPIILGTILLVSILSIMIPKIFLSNLFSGNIFFDPFIGALLGSFLVGNPITSYIFGGEFLRQGISLVAVSAFIIAWVTVGVVQLPAESMLLGKRFALIRSLISFFLAILIAILIAILMEV